MIKSHINRFLQEKHNVTTATEFVEASYSNEGVRGVYAYVAQIDKQNSRPSPQFSKISLVNNFSLDSHQVRMHRSWKVGHGRLIALPKLELQGSISTVRCSDTPRETRLQFVKTRSKSKQ